MPRHLKYFVDDKKKFVPKRLRAVCVPFSACTYNTRPRSSQRTTRIRSKAKFFITRFHYFFLF